MILYVFVALSAPCIHALSRLILRVFGLLYIIKSNYSIVCSTITSHFLSFLSGSYDVSPQVVHSSRWLFLGNAYAMTWRQHLNELVPIRLRATFRHKIISQEDRERLHSLLFSNHTGFFTSYLIPLSLPFTNVFQAVELYGPPQPCYWSERSRLQTIYTILNCLTLVTRTPRPIAWGLAPELR